MILSWEYLFLKTSTLINPYTFLNWKRFPKSSVKVHKKTCIWVSLVRGKTFHLQSFKHKLKYSNRVSTQTEYAKEQPSVNKTILNWFILREDLHQELVIWMQISHFSILVSSAPFIYQLYSNMKKKSQNQPLKVYFWHNYFVTNTL